MKPIELKVLELNHKYYSANAPIELNVRCIIFEQDWNRYREKISWHPKDIVAWY